MIIKDAQCLIGSFGGSCKLHRRNPSPRSNDAYESRMNCSSCGDRLSVFNSMRSKWIGLVVVN